jgi:hypothetical protein
MALTEYKVDRVRSRAASCKGLDRWIYHDIVEGIDTIVTLLICPDDPHIRVSDAGGVRKSPKNEPAGQVGGYGVLRSYRFGINGFGRLRMLSRFALEMLIALTAC